MDLPFVLPGFCHPLQRRNWKLNELWYSLRVTVTKKYIHEKQRTSYFSVSSTHIHEFRCYNVSNLLLWKFLSTDIENLHFCGFTVSNFVNMKKKMILGHEFVDVRKNQAFEKPRRQQNKEICVFIFFKSFVYDKCYFSWRNFDINVNATNLPRKINVDFVEK